MILDDKDGIIAQQAETIGRQGETNRKLELRIAELERHLALYSGNTSKPPSSDGLKKKPQKTKSLRRKGEMPSGGRHKGRTLQQVKNTDRITIYAVHQCERCHADLSLQKRKRLLNVRFLMPLNR